MNETFSLLKKENDIKLHNQFESWLTQERGRQVKGIGHFLEMKSNLSDLILQKMWLDLDLAKVND